MTAAQIEEPKTPAERFVFDFGWGDLQDHWQDCDACDGTGKEECDGSGPPDDCPSCDGAGRHRWGSFYEEDAGSCEDCGGTDVRVAAMYDSGGCRESDYVCLPCYVSHHQQACGCALWNDAEAAAGSFEDNEVKRNLALLTPSSAPDGGT